MRTSDFLLLQSTVVEASLQLPQALLAQAAGPGQPDDVLYKLHLLGFRNGKFFPSTGNSSQLADGGKRRSVATPVIMAKLGEAKHPPLPYVSDYKEHLKAFNFLTDRLK